MSSMLPSGASPRRGPESAPRRHSPVTNPDGPKAPDAKAASPTTDEVKHAVPPINETSSQPRPDRAIPDVELPPRREHTDSFNPGRIPKALAQVPGYIISSLRDQTPKEEPDGGPKPYGDIRMDEAFDLRKEELDKGEPGDATLKYRNLVEDPLRVDLSLRVDSSDGEQDPHVRKKDNPHSTIDHKPAVL